MAKFCRRSGIEWLPLLPMTRELIEVGGVNVFIPGRAEVCGILRSFGRPKDLTRADSLAELEE
jgi:hypothetical protein